MAAQVQRETCRVVAGIGIVLRGLTIADLLNSIQRKRKMDGWTRLEGRTASRECGCASVETLCSVSMDLRRSAHCASEYADQPRSCVTIG